ncbi:MAG: hypothetical protein NTY68_02085 [Candidatus Micrarchaeota archaeon]|nr:hypothetical protein [Candidatus Micrarchaeota archaeon]
MIFFTTSLNPNPKTRELARSLSNLFFGIYFNRGSRSFSDIIKRAESSGCSRVCFITLELGKPLLKMASVSNNNWEWIDSMKVGKYSNKKIKQEKALGSSVFSKSRKINSIFGLEKNPFGNTVDLSYSKKKLLFKKDGKEVFWLEGTIVKR